MTNSTSDEREQRLKEMSNEKDKARARDFIFRSLDSELTPRLPRRLLIDDLQREFTTVRQEERRAAWADAITTAKNELWPDTSAEYGPHRAQQNTVINCVIDALKAAANETREDAGDAT